MTTRIIALALVLCCGVAAARADQAVEALLRRGLEDHAALELETRARNAADGAARAELLVRLAGLYESRGDDRGFAAAAYVRALEALPAKAPGRDDIHYRLGRALEAGGDTVRAALEYQQILIEHPGSSYYEQANAGVHRCFERNQPRVAATVGEHVITVEDLDRVIRKLDSVAQSEIERRPERRQTLLQQMIEEKLMADHARAIGLHLEAAVREELARNVDRFLATRLLESRVKARVDIDADQVREYYEQNRESEFYVEARLRGFVFVMEDERGARQIHRRLERGEFDELRNELWRDAQGKGGGDSGLHKMTDYPEPLQARLDGLEVGQAARPYQSEMGWEVFYVQVHKPSRITPFEKVAVRIEANLRTASESRLYHALADSLRAATPVMVTESP